MKEKTRKRVFTLLSVAFVLMGTGKAIFWFQEHRKVSQEVVGIAPDHSGNPGQRKTVEDIESFSTKIGHLKGGRINIDKFSEKIQHELDSLRSELTKLGRKQNAIVRDVDKIASSGLDGLQELHEDEEAAVELTPEEKLEQEEAQTQAQVQLLEQTLLAEAIDPKWTSSAQNALDQAYVNEEIKGVELVDHECRSTLCRLELNLDTSESEQSFYTFLRHRPWQSYGFSQIDDLGRAVVYLAREGHSLPQLQ